MSPLRAKAAVLVAGLLGALGCTQGRRPEPVYPLSDTARRTEEGLRLPVPRPYLLVKSAPGGGVDAAVVYLPDDSEELWIRPRRGPVTVTLDEGGFLKQLEGRFESRRRRSAGPPEPRADGEIATAAAAVTGVVARPRTPGGFAPPGGLAPGLYRIVLSDPDGGTVPRLEPVGVSPALPEEPPRVMAIRFRPCPDRPEVVERIEVEAEGGSPEALATLRRRIQVLRDDQPLPVSPREAPSGLLALGVGDCGGSFAAYRVILPRELLAAGSTVEAAFPAAEQIDRWRPRAEVHLVRDDQGLPRYLVVTIDPRQGSRVEPGEELDRQEGVLFVDGRLASPTSVIRGVGAEQLYLVGLPEPAPRSLFFSLTPRNTAGLAGPPATLSYMAEVEKVARKEEPRAIQIRDLSIESIDGRYGLILLLDAAARRVDGERTAAANQRQGWGAVRCEPAAAAGVTCTGSVAVGRAARFEVYCEGDPQPCLGVDLGEERIGKR